MSPAVVSLRPTEEEDVLIQRIAKSLGASRSDVLRLALQALGGNEILRAQLVDFRIELRNDLMADVEAKLDTLKTDLMSAQRRALIATLKTLKTPIDARATAEQAEKISASIFGEPKA